ncbi:MAG: hypothetical protein EON61_23810 [Alphaproteobacteria bacterium]|nr:MAG: hypothetical protein EON61_23810 [Alphaproteobacteria bacterium]
MVELRDEAFERAPEGHQVGRGVCAGVVGDEARVARRDTCDLAGAEIDQEIELRVGVSEGRGDDAAGLGIMDQVVAIFIVGDEREADRDDVSQVHLQRHDRPEAPEDTQDDLPERVHGWEYTRASGTVSSAGRYPPF